MRVLGLDYGSARCGIAVSDPTGTIATTLNAIAKPQSESGISAICELVKSQAVERVVIGLPLSLSGQDSAQTKETRDFATRLDGLLPIPIELFDERLTTKQAKQGGKDNVDSRAAAYLLQTWLERQHQESL